MGPSVSHSEEEEHIRLSPTDFLALSPRRIDNEKCLKVNPYGLLNMELMNEKEKA